MSRRHARLVALDRGLAHVGLRWGPVWLLVIWPLALPRTSAPYFWFTPPGRCGTMVARIGPLEVVWQTKP